jgi:SagB-type dehydrogenase family enzyme
LNLELPNPKYQGEMSLEESIYKRRSVRKFSNDEIEKEKISQLLWAAKGKNLYKKTVPSAGAIYPIEIYAFLKRYGLYFYDYKNNTLILKIKEEKEENLLKKLVKFALNQDFIYDAPLSVIICVNLPKIIRGYGKRGKRYAFIEVGHSAQNIHLTAVSLGLGSVPVGAFQDQSIKNLLQLPENLRPIYIIPIGYLK